MSVTQSLALVAPEMLLSVAGLTLLMIAAWGGDKASRLISILSVAAIVGAGAFAVQTLCAGTSADAFDGQLRIDAFSAFTRLMIYAAAIVALVVAPKFFAERGAMRAEYSILILFAVIGMDIMVSARDLLALYIGLELNSLAAYVLASFLRSDERSAEAGLKYFVLGSLASGMLLFGMSLVYGFAGGTHFDAIREAWHSDLPMGAMFGIILMLAGLAFKVSAVPFHMWTPDVYEGAPTPVTTFFASAPKVAAMAMAMRVVLEAFGGQAAVWQQVVIFVSLASIILGAAGAIGQTNIKRLLAYSSINNVGFILVGLAAGTPEGAAAMLSYLAIYVAMTLGGFAAVLALRDANGEQVEDIASLAGLSSSRPGLALAMAIFMFSLAGIPPLFGFWGKFLVFEAAVSADLVPLAAIGIAASVIGAFYYLKVIKIMYFDEPANVIAGPRIMHLSVVIAICAVLVSPLGYFLSRPLAQISGQAAAALFGAG